MKRRRNSKKSKKKEVPKKQQNQNKSLSSVFGAETVPVVEVSMRNIKTDIKVREIQGLITWIFADGVNPSWVNVKFKTLIPKIVLLIFDSLNYRVFKQALLDGYFTNTNKIHSKSTNNIWSCRAPGGKDRIYQSIPVLLLRPKKKKKKKQNSILIQSTLPIEYYLMTTTQLCDNNFPFPVANSVISNIPPTITNTTTINYKDFIELDELTTDNKEGLKLVALDCEMCLTSKGSELCRISIVDEQEKVLYDEFVKPPNPITDYLTQYSGISEEDMSNVTLSLQDVHREIKQWITKNTIIVGHSLENDLLALKIFHHKIIDTSILFPHEVEGFKYALKVLCAKYLNLSIQIDGHDSVQDALAALNLMKLKLANGPSFGLPEMKNENLFDVLSQHKKKSSLIARKNICCKYGSVASLIATQNDQEVYEKTLSQIANEEIDFVVSHFSCLDEVKNRSKENLQEVFQRLDEYIFQIYNNLPKNTLLIAFSGPGESCLNELKDDKEKNVDFDRIKDERTGFTFFTVKNESEQK